MKTTKILISILAALIMTATNLQSQVVIGKDKTPHTGSVLEVNNNSTNKGILLPKVSLTATGTWGLAGTDAAEKGMVVFNTNKTISGSGANGEGMYYWDGTQWVWMAQDTALAVNNGFVGIGTQNPVAAISIVNDGKSQAYDDIVITTYGGTSSFITRTAMGTEANPQPIARGRQIGDITYHGYTKAGFQSMSAISANYQGGGSTNKSDLRFWTSYAIQMYIDSIGQVGIGTTSPTQKLHVVGNSYITGNVGIGTNAPTQKLHVIGNGLATAWQTTSDARYKANIQTIQNPLSIIEQLRGASYNFNTKQFPDKGFSEGKQYGVIAQEVEKVLPELVSEDLEGYKSVNYDGLIPVLIEAIKTLEKRVAELESK